jgi:hypothetical protein
LEEMGLCVFWVIATSNGLVTVFFLLSEINYDFANHQAFAEDNGPHTGFKSSFLEQQLMPFPDNRGGVVFIQSSVESRYGTTVQMWVSTVVGAAKVARQVPVRTAFVFRHRRRSVGSYDAQRERRRMGVSPRRDAPLVDEQQGE